ncbi:hypothetical protein BC937DRAFT_88709 [Endogone sp. FLAS-F59071]|nr:hypothetical protein BC937DRAFT_88709 [Endogone sp. FLAS-F59071]|eukprot:RUS22496.1 hypothetical protein BC937DRAFT_88709 [Endogone sp. FLAS-F59071]
MAHYCVTPDEKTKYNSSPSAHGSSPFHLHHSHRLSDNPHFVADSIFDSERLTKTTPMTKTPKSQSVYPHPWELAVYANQLRYPTNPRVPVLLGSEVISDETTLNLEEARILAEKIPEIAEKLAAAEAANISRGNLLTIVISSELLVEGKSPIPKMGVRKIVRHCRLDLEFPKMIKSAFGVHELHVVHTTIIDTRKREMIIEGINETLSSIVSLGDRTVYRAMLPGETTSVSMIPYPSESSSSQKSSRARPLSMIDMPVTTHTSTVDRELTMFEQYAFLELRGKVPFASSIESYALKSYVKNTGEGRKLDMLFMQDAIDSGFVIVPPRTQLQMAAAGHRRVFSTDDIQERHMPLVV